MRFCKKMKLCPRYVMPFKVVKHVRSVAYEFKLAIELAPVHTVLLG